MTDSFYDGGFGVSKTDIPAVVRWCDLKSPHEWQMSIRR